jgi:hypothetical protein
MIKKTNLCMLLGLSLSTNRRSFLACESPHPVF